MKIGIDFDGVIADTQKLKEEIAWELFQCKLPSHLAKESLVVEHGLMTKEQYRELMSHVAAKKDIGLRMTPLAGAIEAIGRLQSDGHDLAIITSREGDEVAVANAWCRTQSLSLPIISVGYGNSKAEVARGYHAYIDDDFHKLALLQGIVPHLYLYHADCNEDDDEKNIATRIYSWNEFYKQISDIS